MSVASPSPSEQGAAKGEIAYRFCQECSNLLYPREDRQLNRLLYICKSCSSVQEHESACTYRQILSEAAHESMGEKAYVAHDPTVGSSEEEMLFCTMCGQCLVCRECGEPAVGIPDEGDADAGLPHEQRECPKCHESDVVYFQSQQRKGDIGMSLYYVCTNPNCNHGWKSVSSSN